MPVCRLRETDRRTVGAGQAPRLPRAHVVCLRSLPPAGRIVQVHHRHADLVADGWSRRVGRGADVCRGALRVQSCRRPPRRAPPSHTGVGRRPSMRRKYRAQKFAHVNLCSLGCLRECITVPCNQCACGQASQARGRPAARYKRPLHPVRMPSRYSCSRGLTDLP